MTDRDLTAATFRFSDEPEGQCEDYTPQNFIAAGVLRDAASQSLPDQQFAMRPAENSLLSNAMNLAPQFVMRPTPNSLPSNGTHPVPFLGTVDQMRVAYAQTFQMANMPHLSGAAAVNPSGNARSVSEARKTVPDPPNVPKVPPARKGKDAQRGRAVATARGSRKRGAVNVASGRINPTAGWKLEQSTTHAVLSENIILDCYIPQRVRLFFQSALQRLKLELDVKIWEVAEQNSWF